ncbi:MAG: zinc metalloprotease HtpX [Gammaproteobacteria bacterium]
MNLAEWHRHSFLNRLQSLLLIGFMAGFLGLLGHLIWGPEGLLQLLFFGVILAFLNPVASPWLVLRLYCARPVRPAEAPELYAAVTELARRAELSVPALYYVPSHMVNAFAVGRRREAAVAVADGLWRTPTLREIVGVLAHELSHIRNNDLRVMGLADLMSRLTNILSLFGQVLLFMNLLAPGVQVSWWTILLLILAPQLALMAQLGLSRTREYDADLNAALLTGDPDGLASALVKIERRQRRLLDLLLPGWGLPEPSWLRTHPPTDERVRRLLALAPREGAWLSGPQIEWTPGVPELASHPARPRYHVSGLWY